MQKSILLVPHVHEGGVEPRCHFTHLGQVHIAYGETAFGLLAVQFGEHLVLHQGKCHFTVAGADDEIDVHEGTWAV